VTQLDDYEAYEPYRTPDEVDEHIAHRTQLAVQTLDGAIRAALFDPQPDDDGHLPVIHPPGAPEHALNILRNRLARYGWSLEVDDVGEYSLQRRKPTAANH
jgi:hypothetical protein